MSKYNVGDKFVIEIAEVCTTNIRKITEEEHTLYRVKGFNSLVFDDNGLDKLQKYEEEQKPYSEAYNKGLNDAWKLARKIFTFNNNKMEEIFGVAGKRSAFDDLSPQEALAKLEAYEKEQNIKAGDIVKDGKNYFLVTKRYNNTFEGMSDEGYLYCGLSLRDCEKTSKHIDLTDIFKQIGGAE